MVSPPTTSRSIRKTTQRFPSTAGTDLKWSGCCGSTIQEAVTRGRWSKSFDHPAIRNIQLFRQDAGLSRDAHEVGIADPARHDMKVKMFANAGARAVSEVHPDVKTLRAVERGQSTHATLRELHHFSELCGRRFIETIRVNKWRHHEVTRRIRKQIQDDKVQVAAINDQAARILGPIVIETEDARSCRLT